MGASSSIDFKKEAWTILEVTIKKLCRRRFPDGYHVAIGDLSEFQKIITLELEPSSKCRVPSIEYSDANHLSEEYTFPHHLSGKSEVNKKVAASCGADGGICSALKPNANAHFKVEKSEKEERYFDRVPFSSKSKLQHESGVSHNSYRVKVSVQADFPLHVYRSSLSSDGKVISAKEVLDELPETNHDEANNEVSCVIKITSTSTYKDTSAEKL